MRQIFHFGAVATNEVVPVLLTLLTKQDEDAADDEYNISRAAYQCLQLYSQAVGGAIIQPVLSFVEANLRSEDWHNRDAAVSAFGAIMEGPDDKTIEPIVKQALPVIISMMDDKVIHVKDSTAYALGRITEACSEAIDPEVHLPKLIASLFEGLISSPKMAGSCCWALMNLAERFSGDIGCQQNALTPHFNESISRLLQVTERPDADNQLRTAAYEVLNTFVQNAANDSLGSVASLSEVILKRLEDTIPLQSQVVSVEDKITLEEIQTSLCTVLLAIIQRLEMEIRPQSDRIMGVLLQMLSTAGPKSSVPDAIFATVSALANALEDGFAPYMESFSPFLYNALNNQEEPALCSMAIGLVSDITRSLGPLCQPYCDAFMNSLLNNLRVCYFHQPIPLETKKRSSFSRSTIHLTLIANLPPRARLLPTSLSLQLFNALEILLVRSVVTLRHIFPLLPKFSNRPVVFKQLQKEPMRCSTTLSHCAKVSWMLGVESLVL